MEKTKLDDKMDNPVTMEPSLCGLMEIIKLRVRGRYEQCCLGHSGSESDLLCARRCMYDQPNNSEWTTSETWRATVCLSIPRRLLEFGRQIRWIVTLSVILIRFHWCIVSLEIHIYRVRYAIGINATLCGSLDISWLMTHSFIPAFAWITHLRDNRNGIKYKMQSSACILWPSSNVLKWQLISHRAGLGHTNGHIPCYVIM